MATHSLFPGFMKLDYHSVYGKHSAILPTRAWSNTNITGVLGSFTSWSGSPIDAEVMIDAFVTNALTLYLATTFIDAVTIYTIAAPGDPSIPVVGKAIGSPGTNALTTQAKATIQTWVMRDTAFEISKLVFLDAPVNTGFEPQRTLATGALALFELWISDTNAWSSRAGNRPATFFKATYDLDDKLRKEYGMT